MTNPGGNDLPGFFVFVWGGVARRGLEHGEKHHLAEADKPVAFAGTHLTTQEDARRPAVSLADGDELDGAQAAFLGLVEEASGDAVQGAGFVKIWCEVIRPSGADIIIGGGDDNVLNQARDAGQFFVVQSFGNIARGMVDVALTGREE